MLRRAGAMARAAVHNVFPRTSFRLIQSRRVHDEIEVKLLPLLVDGARLAIDIGANVGRYTMPLARLAHHVHAFEPHPRLCRILKAALPANVTVHQIALSDQEGAATLHVPLSAGREDEGIAHLSPPTAAERSVALPIRQTSLDSLALADTGFMKIDVEGYEERVLAGGQRLIDISRPAVIVECEDRHCPGAPARIQTFFAQREYAGFFVHRGVLQDIAVFTPAMQDPQILRDTASGTARSAIPYVNNFLFFPKERLPQDFTVHGNALLAQ